MNVAKTSYAVVTITLEEPTIFSARAATEGDHETLSFVPGARLLGWAAEKYASFGEHAWVIFHSGRVRFNDGAPVTDTGAPAYAVPRIFNKPKDDDGEIESRRLVPEKIWLGKPTEECWPVDQDGRRLALDGMKGGFVAADGSQATPPVGRRLHTATHLGRHKDASLFGYSSLHPGAHGAPQVFRAVIEADGLDEAIWKDLLKRFDGDAFIGRSGRSEYGRVRLSCREVATEAEAWRLPEATLPNQGARSNDLVIWLLSDLQLLNIWGMPALTPRLKEVFPCLDGEDAPLSSKSVTGTRRWSPYNRKLKRRDSEKCVLEAGSVLVFENCKSRLSSGQYSVGESAEIGLGRIWVNPPLLAANEDGKLTASIAPVTEMLDASGGADNLSTSPSAAGEVDDDLVAFLKRRRSGQETEARDRFVEAKKLDLQRFYDATAFLNGDLEPPSASHWGTIKSRVAALMLDGPNPASIDVEVLLGLGKGRKPQGGAGARRTAWETTAELPDATGSFTSVSLRAWMGRLFEPEATPHCPASFRKDALRAIAEEGMRLGREKRL